MAFDIDAYRAKLDQSIAAAVGDTPQVPAIDQGSGAGQPATIGGPSTQATAMGVGSGMPAPRSAIGGSPTPSQLRMGATPVQRAGAQAYRPSFEPEKLSQAKNVGDIINAMKPDDQNQYLNAWEKQHGSIEDKWAAVQQEMGHRPDPKRKVDRKEAFEMLMEFGLNLMKSNAQGPDDGSNWARAATDTVRTQQGKRETDALRYDQQATQVRNDRDKELKEIGSLPGAIDKQSQIDLRDSTIEKNARGPQPRVPKVVNSDQGVYSMDETGAAKPLTGIDGKPLTAIKTRTGGGAAKDTRPSEQKKYEHLISLGTPKEAAKFIAYKQKTGDPQKDHSDIFKTALRSTFGDEAASKRIADSYIEMNYGADAIQDNKVPLINRPETPPAKRRVYDLATKTFKDQ